MEHKLKCWPEHYAAIDGGYKTVELRLNDRPYQRGDALLLQEWEPVENGYTGRELRVRVTHVLSGGPWLAPGYVALSIRLMGEDGRARIQEDFRQSYDKERARVDKLSKERDEHRNSAAYLTAKLADVDAERLAATAEAAMLRQALMSIRKDVHFAHRTVDSDGKWDTLCNEVMSQIDNVTPNGTPGAEMLRDYRHAREIIRDLENKMAPANEHAAKLERQLAELTQLVGAETPIAALTLAQSWQAERAHMQERIRELEGDDITRLSSIIESMYAKIGRSLPLETLSKLLLAVEGLRQAWNSLGRCVDEFEPEDMTACSEHRGFLDDAILAVLAVVPELQDDSHEKPTITPLEAQP
jgi:hypothetical protein